MEDFDYCDVSNVYADNTPTLYPSHSYPIRDMDINAWHNAVSWQFRCEYASV